MSIKGQTHAKRAREFALKERRELKKAKKEARLTAIDSPDADGIVDADGEDAGLETQPEPTAEWVQ